MNTARRGLVLLSVILAASACEVLPPPEAPVIHAPPALRAPDWSAAPAAAPEPHSIDVRLKPILEGREIGHVEVALRFSEPPGEFAEPRPLVLSATDRGDGEGFPLDAIEDVSARDAEGALTLQTKAGGVWRSERRPSGAINVGYRVRVARADGAHGGARAIAGGFLATGASILMLPETADAYTVKVAWDLSGAGAGVYGAASVDAARVTMAALRGALFIAGPIGHATIDTGGARVEGAWLGKGGADPIEVVAFAARAHDREGAFFHDTESTGYSVFVRAAPGLKAGVVPHARSHGLLVLAGDEPGLSGAAKLAISRELAKHWMGGGAGFHFEGEAAAARALEAGLAAHFGREIALGAGLVTPAEVEAELRGLAERHALRGAREAAEDRGALYAADVDAAIRAKSGGKRSLDDVVHALLDRARGDGASLPIAAWREIVRAELGPEAEARFDAAMVKGEAFTPRDDAFGACFKPAKKRMQRDGSKATVEVTVWARDAKVVSCARGRAR